MLPLSVTPPSAVEPAIVAPDLSVSADFVRPSSTSMTVLVSLYLAVRPRSVHSKTCNESQVPVRPVSAGRSGVSGHSSGDGWWRRSRYNSTFGCHSGCVPQWVVTRCLREADASPPNLPSHVTRLHRSSSSVHPRTHPSSLTRRRQTPYPWSRGPRSSPRDTLTRSLPHSTFPGMCRTRH